MEIFLTFIAYFRFDNYYKNKFIKRLRAGTKNNFLKLMFFDQTDKSFISFALIGSNSSIIS